MRIGELSARTGASIRSLRYYEEQGLLHPDRSRSGHRLFAQADEHAVLRIRRLFAAGFCSTVVRELLPALADPGADLPRVDGALTAAEGRLRSELRAIGAELAALHDLRRELGLAPHTHVTAETGAHDAAARTHPAPTDHRDRRLR